MFLLAVFEELVEGVGGAVVQLNELDPDTADLFTVVACMTDDLRFSGNQSIADGAAKAEFELLADVELVGCVQQHARAGDVLGIGPNLAIATADSDAEAGHQANRGPNSDIDHFDDRLAEIVPVVDRNHAVDSASDEGVGLFQPVGRCQDHESGIPAGAAGGPDRFHKLFERRVSQGEGCDDAVVSTTLHCCN